jgi:hypothetical protein
MSATQVRQISTSQFSDLCGCAKAVQEAKRSSKHLTLCLRLLKLHAGWFNSTEVLSCPTVKPTDSVAEARGSEAIIHPIHHAEVARLNGGMAKEVRPFSLYHVNPLNLFVTYW